MNNRKFHPTDLYVHGRDTRFNKNKLVQIFWRTVNVSGFILVNVWKIKLQKTSWKARNVSFIYTVTSEIQRSCQRKYSVTLDTWHKSG